MESEEVTDEMRELRIEQLIGHIKCFSDLEFQRKVWVENSLPNIRDTWEESMCMFFDDVAVDALLTEDKENYGFSDLQLESLWKLRNLVRAYSNKKYAECDPPESYSDPKEIVEDPEWHKVVAQAKVTLKAFEGYEVPKRS